MLMWSHNRGMGVFHGPDMGIAGIVDSLMCEACFISEQDSVCRVCLEYGLVQIPITEVHSWRIVSWCKSINSQGGTDATTFPAEFSRMWHDSCESAVRYLEFSLKDYSLRTASRLPLPRVFAQNAPVRDHVLVSVLSPIGTVCDECWKMSYE